jgi:ribosomal protein S18 acetylase RimI-like enzyme
MFLGYAGEELVGFASLPAGDTPELVGAVHPGFRRRGVARQLLAAARREARERGCAELILVCETSSPGGIEFAQAVGGCYDSAEYQLELRCSEQMPPCRHDAGFELRIAKREDAKLLAQIGEESFGPGWGPRFQRVARWLDDPINRFYVGVAEGEPVGALRVARDPGAPTGYIYTFGVRQAFQRRGYGRRLLGAVVARLFAEGCVAVRLEVDITNLPALALYRSSGFQVVTEYHYYRMSS